VKHSAFVDCEMLLLTARRDSSAPLLSLCNAKHGFLRQAVVQGPSQS